MVGGERAVTSHFVFRVWEGVHTNNDCLRHCCHEFVRCEQGARLWRRLPVTLCLLRVWRVRVTQICDSPLRLEASPGYVIHAPSLLGCTAKIMSRTREDLHVVRSGSHGSKLRQCCHCQPSCMRVCLHRCESVCTFASSRPHALLHQFSLPPRIRTCL